MQTAKVLVAGALAASSLTFMVLDAAGVLAPDASVLQHVGVFLLSSIAFLLSMATIESA